MPATAALPEQRVLLDNISWETYERLLAERDSAGTRFTYDNGVLEIMVVYVGHENPNRTLASLVEIVAEETGRDLYAAGEMTHKRADLKKGFEPDSCYYLDDHADAVRGRQELDVAIDPPADLVIEVDITRSSLNKFPISAAIGIPEVWRYDGERLRMYRLDAGEYREIATSVALPPLTAVQATVFLQDCQKMKRMAWLRKVREWVRSNHAPRP